MKLYEIDEQIDRLLDMQWQNDLSDEEIEDTLNSLLMDKYDKCVNVSLFIKNLEKDITAFTEEEKKLNARRKSMEKKVDWLKNYLSSSLQGEKIDDPRVRVSYGRSRCVVIDNEAALPSRFLVPQEPKIDKTAIREAIKSGETVEGAHIEESEHIIIK